MASVKLREPTREEKNKIYNAAVTGDLHTIQQLASSGVDVTGIVDLLGNNWTALHKAGQVGHNNIVTFLLSHGARVNDVDDVQCTPLHWAALRGHTDTVALLVKSGADVNMKSNGNQTPLELAAELGHDEIVKIFMKKCKPNMNKLNNETQKKINKIMKEAEKKESSSNNHSGSHDLQQGTTATTRHSLEPQPPAPVKPQTPAPVKLQPPPVEPVPTVDTRSTADKDGSEHFDCLALAKYLKKNLPSLSNLPYSNMKLRLVANDVITFQEKKKIDQLIGEDQMAEVIDILHVSLKNKSTTKFKGFLQAMEESGDKLLEETARSLGGSKSVPDS